MQESDMLLPRREGARQARAKAPPRHDTCIEARLVLRHRQAELDATGKDGQDWRRELGRVVAGRCLPSRIVPSLSTCLAPITMVSQEPRGPQSLT